MDDNKENRRSSILKSRKPRNPLGDVEERVIIDSDEENDTTKPKPRRVSFASNNQVKPFATDEDKNTIWDSTYEETAFGSSESSPPTLDTLHSIATTKTATIYEEVMEFTAPIGFVTNQVHKSNVNFEESLDFTTPIVNYPIQDQNQKIFAKMNETSINETLDYTLPVGYNILEVKNVDENKTIICNDEITADLTLPKDLNLCVKKNDKNLSKIDTNMSFTQAVGEIHVKDKTLNDINTNMSFTQAIDGKTINNKTLNEINNTNMSFTQVIDGKTVNNKTLTEINTNMSFTQVIDGKTIKNKSLNELNNTNMSFTQGIDGKTINSKTLNEINTNMSLTEIIDGKTINNKSLNEVNNTNMSLTQVIDGITVNDKSLNEISTNLSFTQAISSKNIEDKSMSFEISLKNPLIIEENQSKSEFSKIAAGDLNPSFSKLKSMPLGEGLNPSEFEVSLSELKSLDHTQAASFVDLTLENSISTLNLTGIDEQRNETGKDLLENEKKREIREKLNDKFIFEYKNTIKEIIKDSKQPDLSLIVNKLKDVIDLNQRSNKIEKTNRISRFSQSMITIEDSNHQSEIEIESNLYESVEAIIRSLEENNKRFWKLLSIERGRIFKFSTLYNSINLVVNLKENSEQVENLSVFDTIRNDAEKDAVYVQKVFLYKLLRLKSALGMNYDIRSLLDFIRETMLKQRDFLREYERLSREFKLIMDENFRIQFKVIVAKRKVAWKFLINMSSIDFQPDRSVEFLPILSNTNDSVNLNDLKVEKVIKKCSNGIGFIKDFINNIHLLIENVKSN